MDGLIFCSTFESILHEVDMNTIQILWWSRFVTRFVYSPVCVPSQCAVNPRRVTVASEWNLTQKRLLWDTKTGGL